MAKNGKRKNSKYPGLDKKVNSKMRQELIDHDYIHKLNDEEKKWLSNFNEEYLSGNFDHKGKKFHKTRKEKLDCYDRNNARNRCIFTRAKAIGRLRDLNDGIEKEDLKSNPEVNLLLKEKIEKKFNKSSNNNKKRK